MKRLQLMNRTLATCATILIVAATFPVRSLADTTNVINDRESVYTQQINRRAEKIVATLNVADSDQGARVRAIIVKQYRDLRAIHDARDAKIKPAKGWAGTTNKMAAEAEIKSAQDAADTGLKQLHGEYLSRLSGELSPEQVDQVKDGMTYGVVPLTYGAYLKRYRDLTDEQKQKIKDWLVEARELAMDAGSSQEKHAWFGKYKGKINNYLSAAGYDAKTAERNLKKADTPRTHRKPK